MVYNVLGNFVINCLHMDNISLGSQAYSFVYRNLDMASGCWSLLVSNMSVDTLLCSVYSKWTDRY